MTGVCLRAPDSRQRRRSLSCHRAATEYRSPRRHRVPVTAPSRVPVTAPSRVPVTAPSPSTGHRAVTEYRLPHAGRRVTPLKRPLMVRQ